MKQLVALQVRLGDEGLAAGVAHVRPDPRVAVAMILHAGGSEALVVTQLAFVALVILVLQLHVLLQGLDSFLIGAFVADVAAHIAYDVLGLALGEGRGGRE